MNQWNYLPKVVEIEMSHQCPIICSGCAIREEIQRGEFKLSAREIFDVLNQAGELGIPNYSLTGGEPFLDLPLLGQVINQSELDLVKINTNAFTFTTPRVTREIFTELQQSGFAVRNKKTIAWLNISIGQQNAAGVPLENSVFACQEFFNFFPHSKAGISLIVFSPSEAFSYQTIDKFVAKYQEITAKKFDSQLIPIKIIPSSGRECSTALKLNHIDQKTMGIGILIEQYLHSGIMVNCIPESVQARHGVNAPRILIRADGSVYSCYGFSHVYNLGNIKSEKLKDILNKINDNPALVMVLRSGLKGLLRGAEKLKPGISQNTISISYGLCNICQLLSEVVNSYNTARKKV